LAQVAAPLQVVKHRSKLRRRREQARRQPHAAVAAAVAIGVVPTKKAVMSDRIEIARAAAQSPEAPKAKDTVTTQKTDDASVGESGALRTAEPELPAQAALQLGSQVGLNDEPSHEVGTADQVSERKSSERETASRPAAIAAYSPKPARIPGTRVASQFSTPRAPEYSTHRAVTVPTQTDTDEDLSGWTDAPRTHGYASLKSQAVAALTTAVAVEAFQWAQPVAGAQQEIIATDGARDSIHRWVRVSAPDHLPTLSFHPGTRPTPLMSQANAVLLAAMTGAPLQPDTGIVFGRVPAGWTVSFTGRAEKILFFDPANAPVAAQDTRTDRFFALINAAPGAHLLQLLAPNGESRAALLTPVLEGTGTYVDVPRPTQLGLSGRVLDAGSAHARGLSQLTVHVVGQPGKSTITAHDGSFVLNDVVSLAGQPLFLEVSGNQGFTHRYRVVPTRGAQLTLFRFDEEQIRFWLDQLEGGISPDSGMILAALPAATAAAGDGNLTPSVRPLARRATLAPETYTLSAQDRLMVRTPLRSGRARFLAVQVPEGINIAQTDDRQSHTTWSELVIASPGVVNVLGPN
jgi:hypothetical protein